MKNRKRKGVLLVFVLGTAMLIAVIGLSALLSARVEHRSATAEADAVTAQWCASAGIEVARQHIADNVNWRTARGPGTWYSGQACGPGNFSVAVTLTPDADTDAFNDPCTITATGVCNGTTRQIQVVITDGWVKGGLAPVVSTTPP